MPLLGRLKSTLRRVRILFCAESTDQLVSLSKCGGIRHDCLSSEIWRPKLKTATFRAHEEQGRELGGSETGGKRGGLPRATSYHTRVSINFIPMTKTVELLPNPEEDITITFFLSISIIQINLKHFGEQEEISLCPSILSTANSPCLKSCMT